MAEDTTKEKNPIVNEYVENIEEHYKEFIKSIKNISELIKNNPSKLKKNTNIEESSVSMEVKDENEKKDLCSVINDITAWTDWSVRLSEEVIGLPIELAKFIANIIGESVDFVINLAQQGLDILIKWINDKLEQLIDNIKRKLNEKRQNKKNKKESKILKNLKKAKIFIKKVIAKVKMIILKVKKAILEAQLWVYKTTKSAIEYVLNGKAVAAIDTMLGGILNLLKVCSNVIIIILELINNLVQSLLAIFLGIEAGNMGFFLAPKQVMTGKLLAAMKPIEVGNDIFSFALMELLNPTIEKYTNAIKNSNTAVKVAHITQKVAQFKLSGEIDSGIPLLQKIDTRELINIVQTALLGLLNPAEPLPKYERVSPINLRFLVWLTTVFEPTMKASFGIPGMP